jgi:Skp family chaperone for outer membrane proteins
MKSTPMFLAVLAAAAPLAAFAQVERSQATIIGPAYVAPQYVPAPGYPSSYAADCAARQDDLQRSRSVLDDERIDYDRERDQLDSEAASLAAELRALDSTNTVAVADYNARSADHNRRVNEHNQRVADMNSRAAQVTTDIAEANRYCAGVAWYRY